MSQSTQRWTPLNAAGCTTVAAILFGLSPGTGGHYSEEYLRQRGVIGYPMAVMAPVPQSLQTLSGIATQLEAIRAALRLSVKELAGLFDVSRQTIYNWQSGAALDPRHEARIREITTALEPRMALFQAQTGRLSHRVVADRTTLLEAMAQNRDAEEWVGKLAGLLTEEAAQKARLTQRLQGRRSNRGAAERDSLS